MDRPSVADPARTARLAGGPRLAQALSSRAGVVALSCIVSLGYALTASDFHAGDNPAALAAALALAIVNGVALLWRRQRPMVVMAIVLGADLLFLLLVPEMVIPFASLVAIWTVTREGPAHRSLVGLAALLGIISVNSFNTSADDTLFTMVLAISVWALAERVRSRGDAVEAAARRAVSDEQARIARELHDVIAHTVSVIVVQATAAGAVFDSRPDQARAALQSIEGAGRDALVELRRLLSAVRVDETDAPSTPQPGLARLGELTAPLRAAGLQVVVTQDGTPSLLPAGVDLSAYRIVQEALTNTLRHARATLAEVTFRYSPDAVEIDVVDDGRGEPHRIPDGPHYGLIGMRERAALVGGTLEAGPTAHGGYRVHARLPVGTPS